MTIHAHEPASNHAKSPRTAAAGQFRQALDTLGADAAPVAGRWTPRCQVEFLNAIASGATVREAAALVGLSPRSAYMFRKRPDGDAFNVGWEAAGMLARDALHDMLYDRAVSGQRWTLERDDGRPSAKAGRVLVGHFDEFLGKLSAGMTGAQTLEFMFDRHRATIAAERDTSWLLGALDNQDDDEPMDNESREGA